MPKKNKLIIPKELVEQLRNLNCQKQASNEAIIHITTFLGELKKETYNAWTKVYKAVGLDPTKERDKQEWSLDLITGELTRVKK